MASTLTGPGAIGRHTGFVGTQQPRAVPTVLGVRATRQVVKAASDRPHWLPGADRPDYLDGSLPGDFGWDPLGLGKDPEALKWYAQAELVHARFAMLGVAGMLLPELVADLGLKWPGAGVKWYDAGAFTGYFAPVSVLFAIQFFLMGWAEMRRYQDIVKPGSANVDPIFSNNSLPSDNSPGYPGGIFDPFGWSKGDLETLKLKEIKNGRLAMFASLGFYAQAFTTHKSAFENWSEHVADPWAVNVWSLDLAKVLGK